MTLQVLVVCSYHRQEKHLTNQRHVPQVIVSLIDATVKPDLSLWEKLPEHHGPPPPIALVESIDSLRLDNMVKTVRLVQSYEHNLPGLRFAYDKTVADCHRMSQILGVLDAKARACTPSPLPMQTRKLHVRFQNSYSILLHQALTLYHLLDNEGVLLEESRDSDLDFMIKECIKITANSMQYRPLGSSNVPFCLVISYVLTRDDTQREHIADLLRDWEDDFDATNWMGIARHARSKVNQRGWIYMTNGSF